MIEFAETNALLAVLEDDENEALRILRDSRPFELVALEDALDRLADFIQQVREENRIRDGRD